MTTDPSQDILTNPDYYPYQPRPLVAKLYGYSWSHIRNLCENGSVHSYNVIVRNQIATLVSIRDMNAYVARQAKRRAS